MFERFTGDARTVVIEAQKHARRLGHPYIGCEHLLLATAATSEPVSAALREHGVTPQAIEGEINHLAGYGRAAGVFSAADREALAAIGIDLDAVRARIEAAFGPGALTGHHARPARGGGPVARLRRRRRCHGDRAAGAPDARGAYRTGHIPFTPRAKKSLQRSLSEARERQDSSIGVEHIALALVGMGEGAVPPILSALGASPAVLRTAILDRYRPAS